ncbi:enoyl-CoA hydratase [Mycolicibacterium komossense]|uniref:Enoyl-CoA hydratase n=1 Tax=Mycolicibacterium komossense TaxID=1779 RepID=A0ABT3CGE3_9MYCO|nr:enoyl-CoA hydratase [Mycolicibacterium komossense]MCV7228550.1 enoyl-CoA hydratase [Mycolicibacterium komossense]
MTSSAGEFISVHTGDEHPGVGTVLISRPPTNALTRQAYRELAAAAAEVGSRDDIAAVVLFGGHEIFSAGDDVPELRTLSDREADRGAAVRHDAIEAVAAIPKPTVAAITGYALGSGLTLALAADWRIGGDNVKVGATEILAGLIPGGGGMARLARSIGISRTKDLVYSGRFVDAREALALGLLDEMVAPDHVYDSAVAWAQRFVAGPQEALAAAKAVIDGTFEKGKGARSKSIADERRRYVEVFAASQADLETG